MFSKIKNEGTAVFFSVLYLHAFRLLQTLLKWPDIVLELPTKGSSRQS